MRAASTRASCWPPTRRWDTDAKKQTYCDRNLATLNSRIDHIYATSEFTQVSHDVVAHDSLSDHKLVVAEFDIQVFADTDGMDR